MAYDPLRFILNALIQAYQCQRPPADKAVPLLESLWGRLRCHQKIELLGAPEVISLLSDQPQTAKDLVEHVCHWATTTKAACENDGFSFEWDPEGFTWAFPVLKIRRPLSDDELFSVNHGMKHVHGFSNDFYELLADAERHRLYEFRIRDMGSAQDSIHPHHVNDCAVPTPEGKVLNDFYQSLVPRLT